MPSTTKRKPLSRYKHPPEVEALHNGRPVSTNPLGARYKKMLGLNKLIRDYNDVVCACAWVLERARVLFALCCLKVRFVCTGS